MELMHVKALLHQTEFGELVVDGMGCSEPVLSRKQGVLIDNFFVYLADKEAGKVSGPIARVGLCAETGKLDYLISCEEQPFSVGPADIIDQAYPMFSRDEYMRYASLYAEIREIAFKENCTESERRAIRDYYAAWKAVISPSLRGLYEELAPSYFAWMFRECE